MVVTSVITFKPLFAGTLNEKVGARLSRDVKLEVTVELEVDFEVKGDEMITVPFTIVATKGMIGEICEGMGSTVVDGEGVAENELTLAVPYFVPVTTVGSD